MNRHGIAKLTGLIILVAGVGQPASISINLNPAILSGSTGSALTFNGTLTNTATSTIFLNAAGINLAGFSPINEDTGPFFANAPISLAGGASTASIGLFTINIPSLFAAGPYQGTFTVLGGTDGTMQSNLGTANFTVQVAAGPAIPEPCTTLLVAVGTLVLFRRGSMGCIRR
jgi:hypothetical protein